MASYVRTALVLVVLALVGAQPAAGATLIHAITDVPIPTSGQFVQTQSGKLQTGTPSQCGSPKTVPAVDDAGMNFHYVDFVEQSFVNEPTCVTVLYATSDPSCWSNGLFSASYGGSFDPSVIQTRYLGDIGQKPNDGTPVSYSVVLPPGQLLDTVFHMRVAGAGCSTFDATWTADRPWAYVRPSLTGLPFVGDTLTATSGVWAAAPTLARQWRRCGLGGSSCTDIPGATAATYAPTPDDVGHSLVMRVTGTDSGVSSTSDSVPAAVGIELEALTGQSLDGSEPTQNGRFARDFVPSTCGASQPAPSVVGSVAQPRSYDVYGRVSQSDSPICTIASVDVTAACTGSGGGGAVSAAYLPGFQPATSVLTNYLADGGSDALPAGRTISYSFDVPAGAAYEVVVAAADTAATCAAYDLRLGTAAPYPSSPPTVTGTASEGQTLSMTDGTWTGAPTFTRQWQRCSADGTGCADVMGATDSTYFLTSADVGHAMRARVTATEGAGSASKLSAAREPVAAIPVAPAPPGSPPPPPYAGIPLKALTKVVGSRGLVTLSLTCPVAALIGCTGTDAIKLKKATLASRPFAIAAGKTANLRLTLSKRVRKQLAKRKRLNATQVVSSVDLRNLPVRTSAKLTLKQRRR